MCMIYKYHILAIGELDFIKECNVSWLLSWYIFSSWWFFFTSFRENEWITMWILPPWLIKFNQKLTLLPASFRDKVDFTWVCFTPQADMRDMIVVWIFSPAEYAQKSVSWSPISLSDVGLIIWVLLLSSPKCPFPRPLSKPFSCIWNVSDCKNPYFI